MHANATVMPIAHGLAVAPSDIDGPDTYQRKNRPDLIPCRVEPIGLHQGDGNGYDTMFRTTRPDP